MQEVDCKMRKSGILMHISSLPSPYGIGTMGKEAYNFIDFLEKAGQKLWQVLPIGRVSYGDSPYQAYSSYAGNPYFIDLDLLVEEGLLEREDLEAIPREIDPSRVDYGMLYETRYPLLKKAAGSLGEGLPADYYIFLEENRFWIEDYASFMALKEKMRQEGRDSWPVELRVKGKSAQAPEEENVRIYKIIQYMFYRQWFSLKEYANKKGIELVGDLPIYCACDSSDVWADGEVFMLDENYLPRLVAGCPPDGFSPDGQRWGNPLYDWDMLEKRGFDWWVARLKYALTVFDVVRIDHFRGFDSFFAIDPGEETAVNGRWLEGPKMKLFDAFKREIGESLPIIAEDLGFLTDSVKKLLSDTGYPGMKVLQFAFDEREAGDYLPHNYGINSVCYVGTHDNDTAEGWYEKVDKADREKAKRYFNLNEEEGIAYGLIRGALASVSETAIICMQDYLGLGSGARMNTPSKMGGNWQWRAKKEDFSYCLAERIKNMTLLYGR